ncbi:MAG TPA: rod shape-determining protein MreD [Thermoanaerobaculia bacterium]|mgnify:CR=1 FL=1|nr:rod shape-determining protein MreD [Thermoanaerobaculia bacterium]
MRVAKYLAALLLVALAHFAGARFSADFPRAIDLFLVLTVLTGAGGSSMAGMMGGLTAGWVADALSGGLYGRLGFADTIVGYVTARVAQRLIVDRAAVVLLTIAVATFAQQGILFLLDYGLLGTAAPPEPLWWTFKALAGGLLGSLIYVASGAAKKTRDRRHERIEKLKIGKA